MKILFVTYSLQESFGVGSARSRMLYKMLMEKGHSITLVADENYTCVNILKSLIMDRYDVVYFSGPPFTYYLVSLLFGKIFNTGMLIVDFRDPWSFHIQGGYGKREKNNNLKLKLAIGIEKLIYKSCDKFVVCTTGMYRKYTELFKENKKLVVVYNGHEIEDSYLLCRHFAEKNKSIIRIICCGSFAYTGPTMANRLLNKLKINNRKEIELVFIGTDDETKTFFGNIKLDNVKIKFYERMNYQEVLQEISKSDVGILALRDEEFEYGTKVFDYIGLGLPIYNLFDRKNNFYKTFKKYIIDELDDIPQIDPDFEMRFSRKKQIEKIVHMMENIL